MCKELTCCCCCILITGGLIYTVVAFDYLPSLDTIFKLSIQLLIYILALWANIGVAYYAVAYED